MMNRIAIPTYSRAILAALIIFGLVGCNKLGFKPPASRMVTGTTNLKFDGLQEYEVKLSQSKKVVSFDWAPALNTDGEPSYELYDGANRENLLVRTKQTNWEWTIPNPEVSRTLILSARAFDADGGDNNQEYVRLDISDPGDHTPPDFEGLKYAWTASHDKILLKWTPSPSTDISLYKVYYSYDLRTAIGSTIRNYFMVKNLTPGTEYEFVVRATDASGNEDTNQIAKKTTTDFVQRPDFGGIVAVDKLSGVNGLTQLNVRWLPAITTVSGYDIYMSTAENDNLPFDQAFVLYETALSTDTNKVILGLTSGRTYYFVVRARNNGSPVNRESNRIVMSNSTNTLKAPTFAGVDSVVPGDGADGYEKIVVRWLPPTNDGVWNGFYVRYEIGDCSQPFSPAVETTKVLVSGDGAVSQNLTKLVNGIQKETTYCVQVNAVYTVAGLEDTNTKRLSVTTIPNPPVFAGVKMVETGAGPAGFETLHMKWDPATGTFSYYQVEAARTEADFNEYDLTKDETKLVRMINKSDSMWLAATDQTGGSTTCTDVDEDGTWLCHDNQPNNQLTLIGTQQWDLDRLPTNETLWVRVRSIFVYPGASNLESEAARLKHLSGDTKPLPPSDEHIIPFTEESITSPTSINVTWTKPTDPPTGPKPLYNQYRLWKICGDTARTDIAVLDWPPTNPLMETRLITDTTTTNSSFEGLTSNEECCFNMRAHYDDGNHQLASTSPGEKQCGTPKCLAPSLAADWVDRLKVYNENKSNGFSTLRVEWAPRATGDRTNFSTWQVSWAETIDGQTWGQPRRYTSTSNETGGTITCTDANGDGTWDCVDTSYVNYFYQNTLETKSSEPISGLTPNKRYYFRVRAVHNCSTPATAGGDDVVWAYTKPAQPDGDTMIVEPGGSTSLKIRYRTPEDPNNGNGLWNSIVFWIVKQIPGTPGETTLDAFWRSMNGGVVNTGGYYVPNGLPPTGDLDANVDYRNYDYYDVNSIGTGIVARFYYVPSGVEKEFFINNLEPYATYYVRGVAAYWINGNINTYVESKSAKPGNATLVPTLEYGGIGNLVKFNDSSDFNMIKATWTRATGDCTRIEVSAVDESTGTTNWGFTAPCSSTGLDLPTDSYGVAFKAGSTYLVKARAVFAPLGPVVLERGQDKSLSTTMTPNLPATAYVTKATGRVIPLALDEVTVEWNNPQDADGVWSHIMIVRAWDLDPDLACQNAVNGAKTFDSPTERGANAEYWDPNVYTVVKLDKTTAASGQYIFNDIMNNRTYCFVVQAIYDARGATSDRTYYAAHVSDVSVPADISCNNPKFEGVASADLQADTWPDGTAKILLTFSSDTTINDNDCIDEYWVYYSQSKTLSTFGDFSGDWPEPWQKVTRGDETYDNNTKDKTILVGNSGKTLSGPGYFHVKYYYPGATTKDDNTGVSATAVNVPLDQSNFVFVPKAFSGLSYDYAIMTYEASLNTGTSKSSDRVTSNEANLNTCNVKLHEGSNSSAAECNKTLPPESDAKVKSAKNAPVMNNVNWHQAWYACRRTSSPDFLMRLPTEEEWRRAAQYSSYANILTQTAPGGPCNLEGPAVRDAGQNASCVSALGLSDVVGNVSEWVDARLKTASVPGRFNVYPSVKAGKIIRNGIHNSTMVYHEIHDGSPTELGLLMGSNFAGGSPYTRQRDPEAQFWKDTTTASTSTGFRCVAFLASTKPTMDQLALPSESVYSAADTLPEGRYVGDPKPETVTIQSPDVDNGAIRIKWSPWTKKVCHTGDLPTCSDSDNSAFSYRVYRFIEPPNMDIAFTTQWALPGSLYYSAAKPLNPLATTGTAPYTALWNFVGSVSGSNCNTASPENCVFVDSYSGPTCDLPETHFCSKRLYNYVVVVKDGEGNSLTPKAQRFRSPHFANWHDLARAAFRTEIRLRTAAVFPVDEDYQESLESPSLPQVMSFVPMDQSGFDHDFFIQRYEATYSSAAGGIGRLPRSYEVSNPDDSLAKQIPIENTWSSELADCHRASLGQGVPPSGFVGDTQFEISPCQRELSHTSTLFSASGETPSTESLFGGFYIGCQNSYFEGEYLGTKYYLHLATGAEWNKAADWGDSDFNGYVDAGLPNAGLAVTSLEYTASDTTTCNTENPGIGQLSPTGSRTKCQSRYGVFDMVGNGNDMVIDKVHSPSAPTISLKRGLDNGIDGLWLNQQAALPSSSPYRIDMLRGLVTCGITGTMCGDTANQLGWVIPVNQDTIPSNTNGDVANYIGMVPRGGAWNNYHSGCNQENGRFTFSMQGAAYISNNSVNNNVGRCVR